MKMKYDYYFTHILDEMPAESLVPLQDSWLCLSSPGSTSLARCLGWASPGQQGDTPFHSSTKGPESHRRQNRGCGATQRIRPSSLGRRLFSEYTMLSLSRIECGGSGKEKPKCTPQKQGLSMIFCLFSHLPCKPEFLFPKVSHGNQTLHSSKPAIKPKNITAIFPSLAVEEPLIKNSHCLA